MSGLVIDLFAGGGGASAGMAAALGREPDIAINHRLRFAKLVRWAPGVACWEWQGYRQTRGDGALSYGLFCIGKRKFLAHRMAWMLLHGDIVGGLVVRHCCDNVACVRPDHLLLGTQAENLADMRERGRGYINGYPPGAAHPFAKMTAERVREIRALREQGLSLAKIGNRVGLHPSTVHDIVTGKSWRDSA